MLFSYEGNVALQLCEVLCGQDVWLDSKKEDHTGEMTMIRWIVDCGVKFKDS